MIKKSAKVQGIPVCIWGKTSKRVIIAVHGQDAHKEDPTIAILARQAAENGIQVLSFDLPGHGGNTQSSQTIDEYIQTLKLIMQAAQMKWQKISLFACSIGAYFSLQAYQEESLDHVYFLSPIVNLFELIDDEMQREQITEEQLEREQEIETKNGMMLDWQYYNYVKTHPVISWEYPTYILFGGQDKFQSKTQIRKFVHDFQCKLKIEEDAGHYFHTKEELESYAAWLETSI